jgi:hypothetical protein
MKMARGPLAGASGPGKFSKRTDMRLPSESYGEGQETANLMSSAPMAKTADVRPMSRSEQGIAPSQLERVTPLFAPTERPDEPITSGIAMGAGPGPEALGMNSAAPKEKISDVLMKLLPYDETGEIAILYQRAASRGM